jgi:hypothetical protein
MTRKYVRRSKATISLTWIDEETHAEILALGTREEGPAPPCAAITKGLYHAPARHQYAFGRDVTRNHGEGFSYNYVGFIVDHEEQVFRIDVWNHQTGNRAKVLFPLNAIPRDPCSFFEQAKKNALTQGQAHTDIGTLSFNRKAVEETWTDFVTACDFLFLKYEVERMHEITGYDS